MREATVARRTGETDIDILLRIDGSGRYELNSGVPFLDHMLALFAKHGLMDVEVDCMGDVEVDDHHSVEDIGIALGQAFARAMEDKTGIRRYACVHLPMDETLARVCVDVSGRPFLAFDAAFPTPTTGSFDACLTEEFLRAFAFNAGITLHVCVLYGNNTHHMIEAIFKGLARALDEATQIDARVEDVPSTKGCL